MTMSLWPPNIAQKLTLIKLCIRQHITFHGKGERTYHLNKMFDRIVKTKACMLYCMHKRIKTTSGICNNYQQV